MTDARKVKINNLLTGVPGLDEVLCGGLPEYSFNIIAGAPGAGKTTLAHQIMFANATPERPALYFTVLGEPTIKMLRYQQQFAFFDLSKLGESISMVNLSEEVLANDLDAVLERIIAETEASSPGIVVVDSFRSLVRNQVGIDGDVMQIQSFVQRLALHLTSWQATTFLIGEYDNREMQGNAVFTVADGLFWLYQTIERESIVRQIQVMKMRGQASVPGLHTFRISEQGIDVFPRTYGLEEIGQKLPVARRLSTGMPELDAMLGGGIPAGDAMLLAGQTGSGKSALATQFIAEGVRQGENGVIAVFEERPLDYIRRADDIGLDLTGAVAQGKVKVIYLRPLDLSVDESLHEMLNAVRELKAERVVIDSINGFEIALAPAFRHDFRESLYRVVAALTGLGVTVLNTVEAVLSPADLHISPHAISFLTDDVILQRYVEVAGRMRKVMTVLKMRNSAHSKEIREYEVTPSGVVIGDHVTDLEGLIFGQPNRWSARDEKPSPTPAAATSEKAGKAG